jgi:hypothetical protein
MAVPKNIFAQAFVTRLFSIIFIPVLCSACLAAACNIVRFETVAIAPRLSRFHDSELICINPSLRFRIVNISMLRPEKPSDLARNCTELARGGNDFPTIWTSRLKNHPLVVGIPHSRLVGNSSVLDIKLITGERLVFDGDARRFMVE